MKDTLDRLTPYFPWIGLLFIAAGLITYIIVRRLDTTANVLLIAGSLLLLVFAILRPNDVRELVAIRQTRYGSAALLSTLFFAAIAILLYWIAYQNPSWRWDVTETGEFTAVPETTELLQNLNEPVHVIAFYPPSLAFQENQARAILDSMAAISANISYEFVDPESNPFRAQEYDLNFPGTLVFVQGERFTKSNGLGDREIYAALLQLMNPVTKNVYFLTGHGERGIDDFSETGVDTAVRLLRDLGFTVEGLNLFTAGGVPADATVVAIIDPQGPIPDEEIAALRDYVNQGGALMVVRDVIESESRLLAEEDGLSDILAEWGVTIRPDAIIDEDLAQAGQAFGLSFLGSSYGFHSIITPELERFGTRFELARSIAAEPVAGVIQTPLVSTSANAWGETDFAMLSIGVAQPDPEDATGSLTIALSAENQSTGGRLVVFGDASFIANQYVVLGGNSILFSNAMNWLADDELTIELSPRATVERQMFIPQTQLTILQLLSLCLGPTLALLAGFGVWYMRRGRR
jgi:ABC-type uncharacterized transport system involved in gliding motility auxiliary subunit